MDKTKAKAPEYYKLRVSENALSDIDNITGFIAYIKHQPYNAIRVGDKLFETIDRIEKNPLVFRECEELPTKNKIYRKAVCMSWLIIYKINKSDITILGVIHGRRQPSSIRSFRKIK